MFTKTLYQPALEPHELLKVDLFNAHQMMLRYKLRYEQAQQSLRQAEDALAAYVSTIE